MSPHSPPVSSVYSLQTAYKLMIITNLSLGGYTPYYMYISMQAIRMHATFFCWFVPKG